MANFDPAFEQTLKSEGGYVSDPSDPGGETYRGVARKMHPRWAGWTNVDLLKKRSNFPRNLDGDADLQRLVREFYENGFWVAVRGHDLADQDIAESLYDFAVNAGVSAAVTLAQTSVVQNNGPVNATGVMDDATVAAINADTPRAFLAVYALQKVARYIHICEKRPESRKYFFGWIRRTMEGV